MKWRFPVLVIFSLAMGVLFLVACQTAAREKAAESTDLATVQPESAAATGETADEETTEGNTSSAESAVPAAEQSALAFPLNLAAMLAAIGDYQVEVSVAFEGQDATGAAVAFETVGRQTIIVDPPGSRLDLSASGNSDQSQIDSMALVRFSDAAYLYVPEIGCVSGGPEEFADDMRLQVDPRAIVDGLTGANLARKGVMVNGLETSELRFDEGSMSWLPEGTWSVSGSLFVEQGSDFVTRLAIALEGQGDILGDGRTLAGTYDIVINIGSAVDEAVVLPDACRESSLYPLTPDAFDITAIEDLLAFKSNFPLDEIVSFYMSAMPAAGWQSTAEPDVFEDLAIMSFEKAGATLMVTLENEAGSGTVSVLISP